MKALNHMSIKQRLLGSFLIIGAGAVTLTGLLSYTQSRYFLEKVSYRALSSERETKKNHILSYMDFIKKQAGLIAKDHHSVDAVLSFRTAIKEIRAPSEKQEKRLMGYYETEYFPLLEKELGHRPGWNEYSPGKNAGLVLQERYLAGNPFPSGSREQFADAGAGDPYDKAHALHHPRFADYRERFNLEDIYLLDAASGMVLYSVSKKPDFATDLSTGPYRRSALAKLRLIMEGAKDGNLVKMADFRFYEPNGYRPTAFVAAPLFSGGRLEGIVALSLRIDEINRVMTGNYSWKDEGLGKTGETYLIGDDYLMRSDSRFLIQKPGEYFKAVEKAGLNGALMEKIRAHRTSVLLQSVTTGSAVEAMAGKTGIMTIRDYRGVEVLSAYAPLEMEDFRWAIISEIDIEEAFADMKAIRNGVIQLGFVLLALVSLIAFFLARGISRPILSLTRGAEELKEGKLKTDLPVEGADETARLTTAFNEMRRALDESRARLVESEKMASLGGLVAGVAHEINTPIGVGITSITALKEETDKLEALFKENRMKRSDLEELFSAVASAEKMIGQNLGRAADLIRNFKQVAVDRTVDEERTFDLPLYLRETVESLAPQLKKGGHRVEVHGEEVLRIKGYPGAFSQILTNLVMNSLKHGFEGVEKGKISICLTNEGNRAVLEYEDDGAGIAEMHLKRIFDPFYTTKRGSGENTGLGLHIVYNIVTGKLGGEIACESSPGKGAKFMIKFPLRKEG